MWGRGRARRAGRTPRGGGGEAQQRRLTGRHRTEQQYKEVDELCFGNIEGADRTAEPKTRPEQLDGKIFILWLNRIYEGVKQAKLDGSFECGPISNIFGFIKIVPFQRQAVKRRFFEKFSMGIR